MKFLKKKIQQKDLLKYLEKLLKRIEAYNNLLARGYEIPEPKDLPKRWINEQKFFIKNKELLYFEPRKWFCRIHAFTDVVIPEVHSYDNGAIIKINLKKKELIIRGFGNRKSLKLPLEDSWIKYINKRVEEGSRPKCGMVWTDDEYLYVVIIFGKDNVKLYKPREDIVVDLNAIWNGVTLGYMENDEVKIKKLPENLDEIVSKIEHIYNSGVEQSKVYGLYKRMSIHRSIRGRKIWKNVKSCWRRIFAIARDLANKVGHEIIVFTLSRKGKLIVDPPDSESLKELAQKLGGLKAILIQCFTRRLYKTLTEQANWYGIPIEEKHLPSHLCPHCNNKLEELPERKMYCKKCNKIFNRDEIPILWYFNNHLEFLNMD